MRTENARRYAYAWGAAVAFATMLCFSPATANTFTISGSPATATLGTLPGTNDFIGQDGLTAGTPIYYFTGASSGPGACSGSCGGLRFDPGTATLNFHYLGSEAADSNRAVSLYMANFELFDNQASSNPDQSVSYTFAGDHLVPLKFVDYSGANQSARNGGPMDLNVGMAFALSGDGSTAWVFFDDKGAGPDRDFDDLGIRITFAQSEVPLPGALPLFVSGLGALGAAGWRRKRKAAA